MKFKHFFFASLFAGLVASCSNDVPMPDEGGTILEGETTSYVTISIVGDKGTKADEGTYEYGSVDESRIKKVYLTFFDAGRNFVGSSMVDVDVTKPISVPNYDGAPQNTVERIETFVAQVDLPENINYPRYIIAYVNPTSTAEASNFRDLSTEKLEGAMNIVRKRDAVSASGYRTMNNSMYYDELTGNTRFATEVDFKTQFFKTEKEAEDAALKGNTTIDITVERMEAKVRTSIAGINVSAVSSDKEGTYSLKFVPEAWFVNATEKRTFLIKNFRSSSDNVTGSLSGTPDFGRSFSVLQDAFAPDRKGQINSMANKRSFWALDPTYFYSTSTYPDVSYDVKYIWKNAAGGDVTVNENSDKDEYPLEYRSYENVMAAYAKGTTSYEKFTNGAKTHEYVLENTMNLQTLTTGDAKASMSSVVLLGHYVITDKDGKEVFNGADVNGKPNTTQAFYLRHEADGSLYVITTDNEAIDFFIERSGSTFFVPERYDDGTVKENSYIPLQASLLDANNENKIDYGIGRADFELLYPNTTITGGKIQSEQWRTLTVSAKGKANENLYVYDSATNTYKQYSTLSSDELKVMRDRMYSSFGVLEKFQAGKAYFNVPLKHIWGDLANSSNEFNAQDVKLGDYGVVRNHIYDLTINSIKGLGTGIGDIRQPIVPPTENEKYYINARLNILQWRVVKQSVDL